LPPCPPNCYDDVNHAQCIFIVGSNTAYAHPILFRRIEDAKAANPALKIIFCDPRRTDTAEIADLYLPILPGTDVSLFNGLLHIMLWEGWTDAAYIAAHTTGFETLKATVRDYTPELVSQTCGINKEDLLTAARLFATSAATLSRHAQPVLPRPEPVEQRHRQHLRLCRPAAARHHLGRKNRHGHQQ
jgi:assimilatory nitrate reductase catalytic subunit